MYNNSNIEYDASNKYATRVFYMFYTQTSCQTISLVSCSSKNINSDLKSAKCLKIHLEMMGVGVFLTVTVALKALSSGMGEEVPARSSPNLHLPSPLTVL